MQKLKAKQNRAKAMYGSKAKKITKNDLFYGFTKKASNTHANRAKKIDKVLNSPMKGKISPSCKAQAKKKFKVWPSAYASGWGVRCTRGDFKKKK